MGMIWDPWKSFCVWKFSFFLVIVIVYIFMALVLQVVNPFMPRGNKISKKLKAAGLFKNA